MKMRMAVLFISEPFEMLVIARLPPTNLGLPEVLQ